MATIMEYANNVAERINETTVLTAVAKETIKNNGVVLTGVMINDGTNVSPMIYMNEAYENDVPVEEAAAYAVKSYNNSKEYGEGFQDIGSKIADFKAIKGDIVPRLIGSNNDVSGMPHKAFFNLNIIYAINVNEDGTASVKIDNKLFDRWDITLDELDSVARENIQFEYADMADILAEAGFPPVPMPIPMKIITNKTRMYGAAGILSKGVMDSFTEDMYLIPSSIHEWIAVPAEEPMALELGKMIREINTSCVKPEEVLDDEPFFFDYAAQQIRKAVE